MLSSKRSAQGSKGMSVSMKMSTHRSAEAVESAEREAEGSTTRAMLVDNNTTA
jgi:hypothetical protein